MIKEAAEHAEMKLAFQLDTPAIKRTVYDLETKIKEIKYRHMGAVWSVPEYKNDKIREGELAKLLDADPLYKQYCDELAEAEKNLAFCAAKAEYHQNMLNVLLTFGHEVYSGVVEAEVLE